MLALMYGSNPSWNRCGKAVTQNSASLTFLPSEDVSQWPEYLRRKMERGEVARDEEEREV